MICGRNTRTNSTWTTSPRRCGRSASYQGHQWTVPSTSNVMLFFYRKDLFDKAGKQPPKTFTEYRDLAKSFNTPLRAGTISCQRPVDAALNESSWYINALGDGWFDDKWQPIFNDPKGVAGDQHAEGDHPLRAAGLHQRRQRRMHDRVAAGYRGDGRAMGDPRAGDGRPQQVPRGRQDGLGGAAAGPCAVRRRRVLHLRVHQAGPRNAVPHPGHGDQQAEPARRRRADGADPDILAGRRGVESKIPLLSGGPCFARGRPNQSEAAGVLLGRRLHHPPHAAGTDWGNGRETGARCRGQPDRERS